jgi:hypothetical protein
MTHHAGVAQHKRHIIRKNQTRDKVARRAFKGRTLERRHRQKLECRNGVRISGLKKQPYLRSKRISGRIFAKTPLLEIMKLIARSFAGCEKSGTGYCGGVSPLLNRRRAFLQF